MLGTRRAYCVSPVLYKSSTVMSSNLDATTTAGDSVSAGIAISVSSQIALNSFCKFTGC